MQHLFVFWCKFALNCGVTAPDFPTNLVRPFLQMFFRRVLDLIELLILTRDGYERKARARQKQIESRLTRDLFAFRLSFLVKNHQNARARTFFFGKVCKCAFFLYFGTPLPCGRVPSEGTARQCRAFRQGFSPKKNIAARLLFAP